MTIKVSFSPSGRDKIAEVNFKHLGTYYTVCSKHMVRDDDEYFRTYTIIWNSKDRISGVCVEGLVAVKENAPVVVLPELRSRSRLIFQVIGLSVMVPAEKLRAQLTSGLMQGPPTPQAVPCMSL